MTEALSSNLDQWLAFYVALGEESNIITVILFCTGILFELTVSFIRVVRLSCFVCMTHFRLNFIISVYEWGLT